MGEKPPLFSSANICKDPCFVFLVARNLEYRIEHNQTPPPMSDLPVPKCLLWDEYKDAKALGQTEPVF